MDNAEADGEIFIIGGEEFVTLNNLFEIIASELKVAPPRIKIPLLPVLWMATLCEFVCVPLKIEPPLHRRRVSFFKNNRAFSVEKAKRILGYKSEVTLREGIRKTINWYEKQRLI